MTYSQRKVAAFLFAPLMTPIVLVLDGIVVSLIEGDRFFTTNEPIKEFFHALGILSIFALPVS